MTRKVHLSLDSNDSGDWRLSVECDDELTEIVMVNPTAIGDPSAFLESVREPLLAEHLARCSACQKAVA
jgi:hypothetical protein